MPDIQLSDLSNTTAVTNGVANGTGVFDKLLNTVNLYIDDQYKNGRLKGPEYATVLLGSIQAVLGQSVEFVLREQMTEAQIAEVLDGTVRANTTLNDDLLTSALDREIKEAQKDNLIAEGLNIPKQGIILDKQALDIDKGIEVKEEQMKGMFADRIVADKQAALLGLDQVVKTANVTPESVYTPKYEA